MNKKLNRLQRDNSDWEWSSFRNWGDESLRSDAANCFFPIYVYKNKVVGYGMVCDDYFHPTANEHPKGSIQCFDINGEKTILNQEGIIAVYPIDESGVERKWRYAFQSFASIARYLRVVKSKDNIIGIEIPKRDDQFKTLWISTKYNAGDYGTKILTNMGFHKSQFKFPKSIHTTKDCLYAVSSDKSIIFDYFGGSGTTAHSTIELNRKEGHSRKYIIVEMGEYFSTVTKPRIEKAIYSDSWKNGVPTNRTSGVSQIVMYMRLESYEDALSNVLLTQPHSTINFGDEYLINYMLDVESRDSLLNVDKFNEPFDFAMYITERNETKKRKIDVVETFNFLIGLSVESRSAIAIFNAEPSANPAYEGAVELRKDANGQYMFQQLEGTLPDGRRALVIWRNITDDVLRSNAALDAYFQKYRINPRKRDFDVIFVNGDNNIENLRLDDENWKVVITEHEFNTRMWEEA